MDLHYASYQPTSEERAAVDALLGAPDSAWRGGLRDEAATRFASGGHDERDKRHLLLPTLHAIQGRIGWISPGALNYACQRLTVPPAEAYGVATFYAMFSVEPQPPVVLHVCDDIACKTRGADIICAKLEERIDAEGLPTADGGACWKRSPCLGLCDVAPVAFRQVAAEGYEDCSIRHLTVGLAITALYPHAEFRHALENGQIGTAESSTPIRKLDGEFRLLDRVGIVDPESLEDYRAHGGYTALERAFELGPDGVIQELTNAKLSGRGGAAFPTGVKWKAVASQRALPHYIVCNADESEPGTFKDRVIMEGDPFALIEAITIAGLACGAEQGFIYIRGEYPEATRRLQNAIDRVREAGYLGANILGRGLAFDIEIRRGAGAYICGEETALLNSIEGKRGEPRNKPPFPVTHGLFGKPTVINNVETLANVPLILNGGAERYAAIGSGNSTGTRLFCLSGCVERPGVYEMEYGRTLRELMELAGGVAGGRKLQAILLGGAAGVFVGEEALDLVLTLEAARAANATLGSGVVMVFDDTIDLRQILLRISAFFRDESCGQCVPCRVGTVRQEEALHRLFAAKGDEANEQALMAELEQVMKDASICGLGQTAASAIRSALLHPTLFLSPSA